MDKDLLEFCMNKVLDDSSVTYADIRFLKKSSEHITVRNDVLAENTRSTFSGIGLRVLKNGALGFSATNLLEKENLKELAKKTIKIANASSSVKKVPVELSKEKSYVENWKSPVISDPFKVPFDEKLNELINITKSADINNDRIKDRRAFFNSWKEDLKLITTDGTAIDQEIVITGGGVASIAVENGESQKRSLPSSHRGNFGSGGFEFFQELKLSEQAVRASSEALTLLNAKSCPNKETSVILKPNQMFFLIHESCGHATELDRALDYEAAYAGTSFLKPHLLREDYFYGNENITLEADATIPQGIGSYGFDHEGVKSNKTVLVENGKFVNYMSSRDTITQLNDSTLKSSGNLRAESWNNMPLLRISNVNLKPGDWTFEEIVSETRDGVIFDTNKSWSIDDLRLNFQFSSEIGWVVENGEIKQPIRSPNYQGKTPDFWKSNSAISKEWEMYGINACGKGEPGQITFAGHGSGATRFDKIRVGINSK